MLNKSPWFIIGALMRGLLDTQPSIQVCAKINKVVHLSMLCIYSIITIQIHRFPLKSAEIMDGKIFLHALSCILFWWRFYSFIFPTFFQNENFRGCKVCLCVLILQYPLLNISGFSFSPPQIYLRFFRKQNLHFIEILDW